jgi:hypothetical protein
MLWEALRNKCEFLNDTGTVDGAQRNEAASSVPFLFRILIIFYDRPPPIIVRTGPNIPANHLNPLPTDWNLDYSSAVSHA